MRSKITILLSLACIEFVFAGIATGADVATIVYSQDLMDPYAGYASNDPATSSTGQQIADDFSLGSAATVNKVTWYGLYTDLHGTSYGGTSSQFSIRFFADDGAGLAPVNAPPFFAELVTVDAVPTGVITTGDGHAVFSYSATLSSAVSLPAGTFWLSIVEADAGTDDTWEWVDNLSGVGTAINVLKVPGAVDDWTPIPPVSTLRDQRPFVLAYDPLTPVAVPIDIKPGSFPNSINPRSKGVIPVAILTTDNFDATTVDPLSVKFGVNGATEAHRKGHIEDVNGDGRPDLVLHFNTQSTGITCEDISASLTGETFDGQQIKGTDSITTAGCK